MRICVPGSAQTRPLRRLRNSLQEFEVRNAQCFDADRAVLLRAIESGYGTLDHFNIDIRKALMAAYQTARVRNWDHRSSGSLSLSDSVRHSLSRLLTNLRLDTVSGMSSTRRHSKLLWQDLMKVTWRDLATKEIGRTPETTEDGSP